MDVKLPNGKIIKGVPEGTPKEVIAQKAIAAGLATEQDFGIQVQPQPQQEQEKGLLQKASDLFTGSDRQTAEIASLKEIGAAPELNELSLSAFKTSLGLLTQGDDEGAMGVIKQNIPNAQFRKDEKGNTIASLPSGEYVLNAPGLSGQDVARFLFGASAFTPAAAASTIPRAIAGAALTETAMQGTGQALGGKDVNAGDVAISGLLGGAGKGVENLLTGVSRVARGQIPEEQARLIAQAEQSNVPLMTSDIIEPKTFVGRAARTVAEQTPLAGTGQARAAQQEARQQVVEQLYAKSAPMYDDVIKSLKTQQSKVKQAAGNRLNAITEKMDDVGQIPTDKAVSAIDDEVAKLTAPSRVADDQTVNELLKYRTALEEGQDLRTLDTLRSDFREQVKGERQVFASRSKAAVERIYKAMTDDIQTAISGSLGDDALRQWQQAKSVYAQEAQKVKSTRLKGLFEKGDLTPENAKSMLLSQKPSEVKALYQSLDNKGKAAARSTLLSEAFSRARNASGDVTPDSLASALTKLSPQVNILFKGADRAQLEGLTKLLNATRQAQRASVTTQTGQQLVPLVTGAAAITDFFTTAGTGATVGAIARAYESKAVRNALLKLNATKKGSTAFEKAVQDANKVISSSLLAMQDTEVQ